MPWRPPANQVSYEAAFNVFLGNHVFYQLDMHGGGDRKELNDAAGDWIKIHHNSFWNREGQALLASLPLAHTAHRRSELQALYQHLDTHVDRLGELKHVVDERPRATLLMTHPGVGAVTALARKSSLGTRADFPTEKRSPAMSA